MEAAPLHAALADGPPGGAAYWLTTADRVRIRIGVWPEGEKGTVLLFPGRTEYVEKYGRAAVDFRARGYATVVIDWRGQGLADRSLKDRNVGHVDHFSDFQKDVAAVLAAAGTLGLPRPFFLVSHSMGGAIALRSLIEGLPVAAAVFSAPMWGLLLAPATRPVAWVLAKASRTLGFSHRYAPSTGPVTYVASAPHADNVLTTDEPMWDYMKAQVTGAPDLALGGPSLNWLHEALDECRRLRALPSPAVPTLTALGSNERVVDAAPIHERMARWPGGRLEVVPGAEHEIMMERPETRDRFFDDCAALFEANTGA
ncbi:alpha/beta fold hydrolase [Solirhodobacter olei]|uniref:alpha/beta fold hydrolase n=1 Tax=Solirhodobacter olei TaxID=2493082 RepID=UPI000FDC2206|nr:alpha/beta hydrolase [Solirhodobacter olei]